MTCENVEGHMDEDMGFDSYLEEMYEDLYVDDAEEFELNQLALDRDLDDLYDDEDEDLEDWFYDSDEYDEPDFF